MFSFLVVGPSSSVVVRRPSVVVAHLQIQGRMQIFAKKQKSTPTALGLLQSYSVQEMLQISWFNVTKGSREVYFMDDLLFHKNFGPNVDNNFGIL